MALANPHHQRISAAIDSSGLCFRSSISDECPVESKEGSVTKHRVESDRKSFQIYDFLLMLNKLHARATK